MTEYETYEREKILKLRKSKQRLAYLSAFLIGFLAFDFYFTQNAVIDYKKEIEKLQNENKQLQYNNNEIVDKLKKYENAEGK